MSSTNKTTNYNLNQYVGTDIQRRTDYNADMLAIDTALKGLEDNKGVKGTAYSNLENNVKIVQGVPAGGKMYLGAGLQTGTIKIKLPKAKSNAMFKFRVKMNGQLENKISSSEYIVKGYNSAVGMGNTGANVNTTQQVTVVKDIASTMSPMFYFCTGATEDYILIGEITDTHNYKSVVVDNVEMHHWGISDDWSKDWAISLVTSLETLTSQYKVAVTPSLNATHLGGAQLSTDGTMAGNSDTLIPSQKAAKTYVAAQIAALVNSSPATLDTLNELATALGNDPNFATTMVNALAGKVNNSDVSTSNAANKLVKRDGTGDIAGVPNLSLITAQNDFIVGSGVGAVAKKTLTETKTILGIDQVSNVSADTAKTANKIVQRDSSGNIARTINLNGTLINVLASPDLNTLLATGFYYCMTATNKPGTQNGYVNVYAYTTGYVLQEYYNFDNSERYTRVYNNNTWSSWKRVFQDEGTSLVANGYTKLSNGLIIQWGTIGATAQYTGASVTFPIAFPNSCLNISLSCYESGSERYNGYSGQVYPAAVTNSGFLAVNGVSQNNIEMQYIAIGK